MQLNVEHKVVRRLVTPMLRRAPVGNGIESRVHLDHIKMLCIPGQAMRRRQRRRKPLRNKAQVRPTGRAHQDLRHSSSFYVETLTPEYNSRNPDLSMAQYVVTRHFDRIANEDPAVCNRRIIPGLPVDSLKFGE